MTPTQLSEIIGVPVAPSGETGAEFISQMLG